MPAMITILMSSLLYAIVRYVAFDTKNAANIPVFITNKALAMAAAIFFAAGFRAAFRASRGRANKTDPASWFRAGACAAICHVPMSLAILSPAYFKEFFGPLPAADAGAAAAALGPRLSTAGELVFLFGGVTLALIFLLQRPQWTATQRRWLSVGAMLTLCAHTLAMGACRGVNMTAKHGYLPPMWILSAIAALAAVAWLLAGRPGRGEGSDPRV